MKIKEEFFNIESLKPYGFKSILLYSDPDIYEYVREEKYNNRTLIQRSRHIDLVHDWDCDCEPIPDVVYHLIKDGLVEAEELKKEFYQLDELSETACRKAVENTINLIIKQAAENYGVEGCNIPELIEHMKLKYDENGNIKE